MAVDTHIMKTSNYERITFLVLFGAVLMASTDAARPARLPNLVLRSHTSSIIETEEVVNSLHTFRNNDSLSKALCIGPGGASLLSEDMIERIQITGYFALWYALNVVYNSEFQ